MSDVNNPNSSDPSENTCVVCFKNQIIFSVGLCDHSVCYECSTRMRILCKQNECPICRQDLPRVIFTKTVEPFATLSPKLEHSTLQDRKYGIVFHTPSCQRAYYQLLEDKCTLCRWVARNFNQLKEHMRKEHEVFYCELCLDNLRIFMSERRTYTRAELAQHRRKGDVDNTSHRGHPLCQFCDTRYLDGDELFRHLRRDHLYCHLCDADGRHEYYACYDELRAHYRSDHHLCEEGACKEEQFTTVFRSDIDLKAHTAEHHLKHLSRSANKLARTLELEFTLAPRQRQDVIHVRNDRQTRNNRTMNHREGGDGGGGGGGCEVTDNYLMEPGGRGERVMASSASHSQSSSSHRPPNYSTAEAPSMSITSEEFPSLGGREVHSAGGGGNNRMTFMSRVVPDFSAAAEFPTLDGRVVTAQPNISKKKQKEEYPSLNGRKWTPEVTISSQYSEPGGGHSDNVRRTVKVSVSKNQQHESQPSYSRAAPNISIELNHKANNPSLSSSSNQQRHLATPNNNATTTSIHHHKTTTTSTTNTSASNPGNKQQYNNTSTSSSSYATNTTNNAITSSNSHGSNNNAISNNASSYHGNKAQQQQQYNSGGGNNGNNSTTAAVVKVRPPRPTSEAFPTLGGASGGSGGGGGGFASQANAEWSTAKGNKKSNAGKEDGGKGAAKVATAPVLPPSNGLMDFPSLSIKGKGKNRSSSSVTMPVSQNWVNLNSINNETRSKNKKTNNNNVLETTTTTTTTTNNETTAVARNSKIQQETVETTTTSSSSSSKSNKKSNKKTLKNGTVDDGSDSNDNKGNTVRNSNSNNHSNGNDNNTVRNSTNSSGNYVNSNNASNNASNNTVKKRSEVHIDSLSTTTGSSTDYKSSTINKSTVNSKPSAVNNKSSTVKQQSSTVKQSTSTLPPPGFNTVKPPPGFSRHAATTTTSNSPPNKATVAQDDYPDYYPTLTSASIGGNRNKDYYATLLSTPSMSTSSVAENDYTTLTTSAPPTTTTTKRKDYTLRMVVPSADEFPSLSGAGGGGGGGVGDFTFTSSTGLNYPILPPRVSGGGVDSQGDYRQPAGFAHRNKQLIESFQRVLASDSGDTVREFKSYSELFRKGGYPAEKYYEHCQIVLKADFDDIFPELLALLPDIDRQRELLVVHERHAGDQRRTLQTCATCHQVLLRPDLRSHVASHSLENNYSGSGNSDGGKGTGGRNAWRK